MEGFSVQVILRLSYIYLPYFMMEKSHCW